jgi:RNA processing factor Prp31
MNRSKKSKTLRILDRISKKIGEHTEVHREIYHCQAQIEFYASFLKLIKCWKEDEDVTKEEILEFLEENFEEYLENNEIIKMQFFEKYKIEFDSEKDILFVNNGLAEELAGLTLMIKERGNELD